MTQAGNFDFVESQLADDLLENGAFCHFRNPATDEPLYLPNAVKDDGSLDEEKAVGAYVRSTSSQAYDAFEKRSTRRTVSANRRARSEAQRQEVVFGQIETERSERFAVLVARFKNTSISSPGEWTPTEDEKKAIANVPKNKSTVDQVLEFAADTVNYPAKSGNVPAAD